MFISDHHRSFRISSRFFIFLFSRDVLTKKGCQIVGLEVISCNKTISGITSGFFERLSIPIGQLVISKRNEIQILLPGYTDIIIIPSIEHHEQRHL
jgi:hypothetical protein